ncbi:MAG: glycosyltransferase family 9 protein, partial [Candidatus Aminicenantales bacterium]
DTFAHPAAAALDVPDLVFFGPTNPNTNGSFRDRDKIARFPMECGPCYKRECATARCMDAVVPADAAALALEMLKEENG